MEDPGLLIARIATLGLLFGLCGWPLYAWLLAKRTANAAERLAIAACALASAVAVSWWAAASVAAMAGVAMATLDAATLRAVLAATALGPVLYVRLVAIAAAIFLLLFWPRHVAVAAAGAAALLAGAWTGHAGAAEGAAGTLQRLSTCIHLLAGAVWFGALLHFLRGAAGGMAGPTLAERLSGFARTGTVAVTAIAITGAVNAVAIAAHGWAPLSVWSFLLGAKLALFAAMLLLAAINRWWLTPALRHGIPGAQARLRVSLSVETACAAAIFALAAALGMADPGS